MHYLLALVVIILSLWALKRIVIGRFKRTPQPGPLRPAVTIVVPVPVSKHKPAGYVVAGLLSLAAGWFFRASLLPEHRVLEPSANRQKENSAEPEIRPLATMTPNAASPHTSTKGCEWVKSFSREDGTYVNAHWSNKPGYAGECSSLPDLDPLPLPHEKARIYEGPRGGHYHYSKSGKKVYEHRR